MKFPTPRLALASLCLVALTAPVAAEVKLNDKLAIHGFLSSSATVDDPAPGATTDHYGLDEALFALRYSAAPVAVELSLYHESGAADENAVLDATLARDLGRGFVVTAGKFLTYLGYEEFFRVDNPTISYANGELLEVIPGYHSGLKLDYAGTDWTLGGAVLDSLYPAGNSSQGDGELRGNQGYEVVAAYGGIPRLTVSAGAGYQGRWGTQPSVRVGDLWAAYRFSAATAVVAEWSGRRGGPGERGYDWLLRLDHQVNERWSLAGRLSGEELSGGAGLRRCTLAATRMLARSLGLRFECSHTDYDHSSLDRAWFGGIQAFLTF